MKIDTKKKQKSLLKKLFHSISPPLGEEDTQVSIISLKKLAKTQEQKDILKLIEQETIPSVRNVWIDYLIEKTGHSKYKNSK